MNTPSPLFTNHLLVPKFRCGSEPPQRLMATSSDCSIPEVLKYAIKNEIWQIVPEAQDGASKRNLALCYTIAFHPDKFIDDPIRAIFGPPTQSLIRKSWHFRSSTEKTKVIEGLTSYVSEIGAAAALKDNIRNIADEFFTNAIFNAPFENEQMTLDRSSVVVLDPEMSAEIIIVHNDEEILLGCTDLFGNVNCSYVLQHLSDVSSNEAGPVLDMGRGGAGIGLFQALQTSTGIFCICHEKKKTFIACTFEMGVSARATYKTPKRIHFNTFQTVRSGSVALKVERRPQTAYISYRGTELDVDVFSAADLTGIDTIYLDFPSQLCLTKRTRFDLDKRIETLKDSHKIVILAEPTYSVSL